MKNFFKKFWQLFKLVVFCFYLGAATGWILEMHREREITKEKLLGYIWRTCVVEHVEKPDMSSVEKSDVYKKILSKEISNSLNSTSKNNSTKESTTINSLNSTNKDNSTKESVTSSVPINNNNSGSSTSAEGDYSLPGQLGFQFPGNSISRGIFDLHDNIMFFLVFVIVFVAIILFLTIINFSLNTLTDFNVFKKVKNYYNVKLTHNIVLETIWIILPSLILLFIIIPSFALLYAMEITGSSWLTMKVIGHQWYWTYSFVFKMEQPCRVYTGGEEDSIKYFSDMINRLVKLDRIIDFTFDSYMVPTNELSNTSLRLLQTTNPIVLPVNTFIKVYVTASDVLHSWTVPSLGIKIDACPGRLNQVNLFIDRIGHFYGQCSELCGVNHGFMPIEIYSVSNVDYISYLTLVCNEFRDIYMENIFIFYKGFNVDFIKSLFDIKLFLIWLNYEILSTSCNDVMFGLLDNNIKK